VQQLLATLRSPYAPVATNLVPSRGELCFSWRIARTASQSSRSAPGGCGR
jgi:hypothetical protein